MCGGIDSLACDLSSAVPTVLLVHAGFNSHPIFVDKFSRKNVVYVEREGGLRRPNTNQAFAAVSGFLCLC